MAEMYGCSGFPILTDLKYINSRIKVDSKIGYYFPNNLISINKNKIVWVCVYVIRRISCRASQLFFPFGYIFVKLKLNQT